MPRKSNDEMIAELEAKLAKAKENAVTRVQTQIEKLEEKKNLLLERGKKIDGQVKDVESEITKLKANDSATFTAVPADEV